MAKKKNKTKSPAFPHLDKVRSGYERIYAIFQMPDPNLKQAMCAAILVKNSTTLLSGTYGTGKTQFIQLIRKVFFSDGEDSYLYDYETCHQELTAFDVLYHLDLAELQKGREVVHPKAMVTARLKFLNEIQRANPGFFNALLPMLSEHQVTYRDHVFEVPDFVCFMDRNPLDSGSSEIPEAFMDRIDFSFEIPAVHLNEMMRLQEIRKREHGYHWGELHELVEPVMTFQQLTEVWDDVKRVAIPDDITMLAGMLSDHFRLCINAERSNALPDFDLDCPNCEFRGELCAHLLKVPGMRITNSMLRLAQALAWLDGEGKVGRKHLLAALPWSMAHRLAIRPEELRKQPSSQVWIRETALGEMIIPKLPFWEKAIKAFSSRDMETLEKQGGNDLVCRELRLLLMDQTLDQPDTEE